MNSAGELLVGVAKVVGLGVHYLKDGSVIQKPICGNGGIELE